HRCAGIRSETIETLRRGPPQAGGAAVRLPNRFGERARPRPLCPGIRKARPLSDRHLGLAGLLQARALRVLGTRSVSAADLALSNRPVSHAKAYRLDAGLYAV